MELKKLQQQIVREHSEAARTLEEQRNNGRLSDPLLMWKIEFLELSKDFWDTRFAAIPCTSESPTREVSRLLLAVAHEHGLVIKYPAPEVLFEDFADYAITFCLMFWLDARDTARNTLASDLPSMKI